MARKNTQQLLYRSSTILLALCMGLAAIPGAARAECPIHVEEFVPDPEATSEFMVEHCRFKTTGVNPFFILQPGYQLVLESDEEVAVITVLDRTRKVAGVRTRIVEELSFEKDGGELLIHERSLNYFAICSETNSVFYFGEDVEFFDEDGNPTGSQGAWLAGRNGARPGIVMPGTLLVGGNYYEELAPEDEALDKGHILALEHGCEAGDFEFDQLCATIAGSNDCDDDEDLKLYAAGVGVVIDDELELASFGYVDVHDDDGDDDDRRGRRHAD